MNEVNQLVLDCMARSMRIAQTTSADIIVGYNGNCQSLSLYGYLKGYDNTPTYNKEGCKHADFLPLGRSTSCIYLDYDGAEDKLKALLSKLDNLERYLMSNE